MEAHGTWEGRNGEDWDKVSDSSFDEQRDLTANTLDWDTADLPDGYYRLRVTVSDALSNPDGADLTGEVVSDPILVDNMPFRSERIPEPPPSRAPGLGEHTREVCLELLGMQPAEIERLLAAGALEEQGTQYGMAWTST